MGLFVKATAVGAYQWDHFTAPGTALIVICLLASLVAVMFSAVALRRAQWDDKDAMLAVVIAVTGIISLSIWYVLFSGNLFNYTEDAIPSANRVIIFATASLLGSIVATLVGGIMMNLKWLTFWKTDAPAAAPSSDRPGVTQGMSSARGAPPSPQNVGSGPGAPRPSGGAQQGTLVQGRPNAAPGASPAARPQVGTLAQGRPGGAPSSPSGLSGGAQQGTLVQGSPGGAPSSPSGLSGGAQQGTLVQGAPGPAGAAGPGGLGAAATQVEGAPPVGAAGAAAPADATMAPGAGQTPGTLLHLDVVSGPAAGSSFNLKEGNNALGRSPDSELFVDDAMVSRTHAMIRVSDGEMYIIDLGSSGGTRVGDRNVEGHPLQIGETVTVGQSVMVLLTMEGPAAPSGGGGQTMVGPAAGSSMALVVQSGPDTSKVFTLREGPNTIGRDVGADVQLSDQQVSRRHAVVTLKGTTVTVSDIGSTYGTSIKGRKLEGTKLQLGDRVFVGQSELVLTGTGMPGV